MMNFSNEKAIFQQIADRLCDEILQGTYPEDARIPSVREYASLLGVNPNTCVKSYEQLAGQNIIYNKRGMGYFVSQGANKHIKELRHADFIERRLPELFRTMKLLGISIEEIEQEWKQFAP